MPRGVFIRSQEHKDKIGRALMGWRNKKNETVPVS
jgi:hypothetical protein